MYLEKEITVLVDETYDELHYKLINQGFKIIGEYQLDDIYMIPITLDLTKLKTLAILKNCILLRNIDDDKKKIMIFIFNNIMKQFCNI